jgi:putative membrane protein
MSVSETRDAARRTRLANERTYLAWLRTGLASFAVCIALGRIVPGVTSVTAWPYEVVGVGYGLLGIVCILFGHFRVKAVETAVDRGEFAHLDSRMGLVLVVFGLVLGTATIALVIFS